jgi:hypothetical protein
VLTQWATPGIKELSQLFPQLSGRDFCVSGICIVVRICTIYTGRNEIQAQDTHSVFPLLK